MINTTWNWASYWPDCSFNPIKSSFLSIRISFSSEWKSFLERIAKMEMNTKTGKWFFLIYQEFKLDKLQQIYHLEDCPERVIIPFIFSLWLRPLDLDRKMRPFSTEARWFIPTWHSLSDSLAQLLFGIEISAPISCVLDSFWDRKLDQDLSIMVTVCLVKI